MSWFYSLVFGSSQPVQVDSAAASASANDFVPAQPVAAPNADPNGSRDADTKAALNAAFTGPDAEKALQSLKEPREPNVQQNPSSNEPILIEVAAADGKSVVKAEDKTNAQINGPVQPSQMHPNGRNGNSKSDALIFDNPAPQSQTHLRSNSWAAVASKPKAPKRVRRYGPIQQPRPGF